MKNASIMSLTILTFAVLATSILPALADSAEPQPGWRYYVVYDQSNGSLVAAMGCSPPPAACEPILRQGQAVLWITDQPAVVRQFFTDAQAGKGDSWHVNMQTHQLEKAAPTGSATTLPALSGIPLVTIGILSVIASVGAGLSAIFALRRIHRWPETPEFYPLPSFSP